MPRDFVRAIAILGLLAAGAPGQEITVRSQPPASSGSVLRRPQSSQGDSSVPDVDWSRVPPWRQTSFFGLRAQGQTFVFVVDCSGSMGQGDRLLRAKRELRRSVGGMRFPQRFHVIFYNDEPLPMPGGLPQSVDLRSKAQMNQWLGLIEADGGTDPRGAMFQALSMKPDGIFLLSDGEFPSGAAEEITRKNAGKIPIHCVDMSGHGADLKRIATESGGEYASRP